MANVSRREVLATFWEQARPYKGRLFLLVVFLLVAYACEAAAPWAGKTLVDLLAGADHSWDLIRGAFFLVAGLSAGSWFFRRLADPLMSSFRLNVAEREARRFAFDTLLSRSYAYFLDTPAGSVVRHIERYSQAMGETFDLVVNNLLNAVFLVATVSVSLFFRSWLLGVGFVVWTSGFVLLQWQLAKREEKLRGMIIEADAIASGRVADAIGNGISVKTFASEDRESSGVARALDVFVKKEYGAWRKSDFYWAVQTFFFLLLELALIWYVLDGWTNGNFTLGDFVLVQASVALLFPPLTQLGVVFRRLPRMFSYAGDVVELARTQPTVADIPGAKSLRVTDGGISFAHVTFGYKEGPPIFNDFSLDVRPGEKIAIVGPSGSGKSTVLRLLGRFYDVRSGAILIDGQDISRVTQSSLRDAISLVPQDPALFHRSVMENIRYGKPKATEAQVIAAAKRAHCHEFIRKLPEGYDTMVGERGVKLSGGERQRVAIARAILRDAPILLLDEATSALDSQSESLIQDALHDLMSDHTVIVIAHRLSTIMQMDRIVVVEDGRVTDEGTHAELIRRRGTYRHLWELQSGGYMAEEEEEE